MMYRQVIALIRQNVLLSTVLLVLLLGRLAISGHGYLEDSDEVDYYAAEDAFDALLTLDVVSFSQKIAITEGKPTETLIKTILVPFHRLWSWVLGVPRHSPTGLLFLGLVNIAVSIAILLLFYLLQLRLGLSKRSAIVGVATLGVFINFNLYTRHLLGYDMGLLLQLLSLYGVLTSKADNRLRPYAIAGLIAALGFTTYHGYFVLIGLTGGYVLFTPTPNRWKKLAAFSISFLLPLLVYELFFRIGGRSFIEESILIGGTISQGSYQEGFTFVWLYLSQVEGLLGVVVLPLFFGGLVWSFFARLQTPIARLLALATLGYLAYGALVYGAHFMVFYGRILHQFYPFLVLGAVYLLEKSGMLRYRLVALSIFIGLSIQYVLNIQSLNSFCYPRQVLYTYGLSNTNTKGVHITTCSELRFSENYENNWRYSRYAASPNRLPEGRYDVVNTCFFSHYPDWFMTSYLPYDKGEGEVMFSKLHFMSYAAYAFEYCSTAGRAYYTNKKFRIQLVKQP